MATPSTDAQSRIPQWFALILSAITLSGGGAWLMSEHARISDLERRVTQAEIEASKRAAQLEDIRDALKDLKATAARTETTAARTESKVADMDAKIVALTSRSH